ncbi:MAG: DUF1361 domain-containing protein [Myxococcota bacterium]
MPTNRGSRETRFDSRTFAVFAFSALASVLWLVRAQQAGPRFVFLWWNLLLAWIPWVLAVTLATVRARLAFWPLLAAWLAFFPNAPYLLTDLVHLKARAPVPLWFDVLFLSAFAWAGCVAGWDSLRRVHAALEVRVGAAKAAGLVTLSVLLSGLGVFLGRFERLNSWDVVTEPGQVATTMADSLLEPRALLYSLAFSCFVGLGYLFTSPPETRRAGASG